MVAILGAFAVSGCARYDMKEDKQGRMIRVDRFTGEVTIIEGDKIVKVKTPDEQAEENKKRENLAKTRYLAPIDLSAIGGGTAGLMLSWHEDKLYYQFWISPLTKRVEAARHEYGTSFDIILSDASGFELKRIPVPVPAMTGTVDNNGKANMISKDDSDFCTEDDYRRIANWNVSWLGFGPH